MSKAVLSLRGFHHDLKLVRFLRAMGGVADKARGGAEGRMKVRREGTEGRLRARREGVKEGGDDLGTGEEVALLMLKGRG